MADERVFKIKIEGVEKSYKDTVKLVDILTKLNSVSGNVSTDVEKLTRIIRDNAGHTANRNKALADQEKAERKLQQILEKSRDLGTKISRDTILATQNVRERTRELSREIELENASTGSVDEKRLQLVSLGRQYRALSEEQRNAEHVGGAMLTQIQALSKEYKELERSLGNNAVDVGNYKLATEGLRGTLEKLGEGVNKTTENTKGMLSMFQAGVGIALLFDEKNSDLAKTMNSLGKIMAIVGALQQANNLLLTKGALASKGAAVMENIHAVQVRARASAIAMASKQTLLASIAQKAFNLIAAMNPYILLAMALISVIGALAMFASSTETATERQKRMNDAIERGIELKDQYASKIKTLSDANISELQRELDLMKARGASEAQLAKQQKKIQEQKLVNAKKMAGYYKDEIESIGENSKRVDEYTKQLLELDTQLYKGKIKNMTGYEAKREKILQNLEISNKRLTQGLTAREDLRNAENDLDKFSSDTSKKFSEIGKRDALAMAEYRVLMAKKGSSEELKAQIEALNQQLQNDLKNVDITNGERLKRREETLQQIQKIESDFRKDQHRDDIALIDAHLSLVKKGSIDEFNLLYSRLENQKKIDSENKELTANQKLQIENKYQADVKKITDDYIKYVSETEINTNLATINARLASVKAGTIEERDLRIDLAKEEARLATENIYNTIEDEKLKASKIKEINENLQNDIREISSSSEVSAVGNTASKETLALTKEYEARTVSKQAFESRMLAISLKALKEEIKIRRKYGENTTELEITLSEMRIKQAENEKNKVSNYFEEMHAKLQDTVGSIMEGVNAIFEATNAVFQAQLDDANEKYDAISEKYDEVVAKREESTDRINELEDLAQNAKGGRWQILQGQINAEMETNKKLADQEKQLAKEKEKQEKEIAKKEKQMKRSQILSDIVQGGVNTALAITNALTVKPFPLGVVLAAVAGTMGAVQVGVMTKQLSKLEDGGLLNGKRHSQGGMRVEGTNIEVEGGEYVVNRESTSRNLGLIKYINSQRRELKPNDLSSFFSKSSQSFEPPFKRMFESGGQLPVINNSVSFDNEGLVEAIQSIKFEPKVAVTDINNAQNDIVSVDNWIGM